MFRVGDLAQLGGNLLAGNRLEFKDLRSRQHGLGNLRELGGGHHEDDVRRRLFDRFQQRIERMRRQLMDLVDDEHLVAVSDRHNRQAGDDHLTHVVDLRVRGRVDLEHVDVAPLGNFAARVARAARLGRRPLHAAQRAGQNARGRRLAHAARPRKHERLRDAVFLNRIFQRARHRRLADDIVELLRAPLAG